MGLIRIRPEIILYLLEHMFKQSYLSKLNNNINVMILAIMTIFISLLILARIIYLYKKYYLWDDYLPDITPFWDSWDERNKKIVSYLILKYSEGSEATLEEIQKIADIAKETAISRMEELGKLYVGCVSKDKKGKRIEKTLSVPHQAIVEEKDIPPNEINKWCRLLETKKMPYEKTTRNCYRLTNLIQFNDSKIPLLIGFLIGKASDTGAIRKKLKYEYPIPEAIITILLLKHRICPEIENLKTLYSYQNSLRYILRNFFNFRIFSERV